MHLDVILTCLYFIIGMSSAIVMVEIRRENLPPWMTMIFSGLAMVLWSIAVKKSKMSVVHLSALYDAVGAVAYFVGFALYGEKITQTQFVGIGLLIFSLYIINK
jgi:multidrug transporter EmrE-like cation transporter